MKTFTIHKSLTAGIGLQISIALSQYIGLVSKMPQQVFNQVTLEHNINIRTFIQKESHHNRCMLKSEGQHDNANVQHTQVSHCGCSGTGSDLISTLSEPL